MLIDYYFNNISLLYPAWFGMNLCKKPVTIAVHERARFMYEF